MYSMCISVPFREVIYNPYAACEDNFRQTIHSDVISAATAADAACHWLLLLLLIALTVCGLLWRLSLSFLEC